MTFVEEPSCLNQGLTGFYGCAWSKQDKRQTTWGQVFWLCVTFYFWFEAATFLHWSIAMKNDSREIDEALSAMSGMSGFNSWYNLMKVLSVVIFVYLTLVVLFGLLHVYAREPLYMSAWHRVIVSVVVLFIYAFEIVVVYARTQELKLLLLSLDISGPYLHVGTVMMAAVLTWPIAWYWLRWDIGGSRVYLLLLYIAAMILLFIWPIAVHTPITISRTNLPAKPKLIANKGLPSIVPENTLLSIELAAHYQPLAVQIDVWVSYDGIPFVLHDANLKRTTDVEKKFATEVDQHTAYWTMANLRKLDAGSWFLESDPYGTASKQTTVRRDEITQQKIPSLAEVLRKLDGVVVNVRREGVKIDHPHFTTYDTIIVAALQASNIKAEKVYWLGEKPVGGEKFQNWATNITDDSRADNLAASYRGITAAYWQLGERQIRKYGDAGLSTNVHSVNTEWMLSLYWAMGVSSVTSDFMQDLIDVQDAYYILHPRSYLITWIVADVVSLLLVLVFWFVNYMIYVGEEARKETILMDDLDDKVAYTDDDTDLQYGTPPVPDVGTGLHRKQLPYATTNEGFD